MPEIEVAPPPVAETDTQIASARAKSSGGRTAAIAIGAVLALVGLICLGAGGVGLWADLTQRDGDYVTSDVHKFSTSGSALATAHTELGSAGVGWLYGPGLLDEVRVRATPETSGARLFVGIGRSADVDHYLAGVNRSVIKDFWKANVQPVAGGAARSAPGAQRFWVAKATGTGPQTLVWKPANGTWTVVVMNADGGPGIGVAADLGARLSALPWIALGFLVAGLIFAAGAALLIVGAVRRR
jgi:hypothetical protein